MNETQSHPVKNVYSQACVYHITLQGRITSTLIETIDDLQVRENRNGEISVVGWLPDQSALIGLLQNLNNLHYGILSVTALLNQ